jgi:hypothetical protein
MGEIGGNEEVEEIGAVSVALPMHHCIPVRDVRFATICVVLCGPLRLKNVDAGFLARFELTHRKCERVREESSFALRASADEVRE